MKLFVPNSMGGVDWESESIDAKPVNTQNRQDPV
jgi:hypothetical protein